MAKADPEIDDAVSLPNPLRKALGSIHKLQLLCLIEQGVNDSDALSTHLTGIRRQSINAHLNELEELGWIRVGELRKFRGSYARVWELTTEPPFSWTALVAHLRGEVPAAAPPSSSDSAAAPTP